VKGEEYNVIIAVIVNTVFHLREDHKNFPKNSFMNISKANKLSNNFRFTTKEVFLGYKNNWMSISQI
jgi:hypothetical protein